MPNIFNENSINTLSKNEYDRFNTEFHDTSNINPYSINFEVDVNVSIDESEIKNVTNSFKVKEKIFNEKNPESPIIQDIFNNDIFDNKNDLEISSTFQDIRILESNQTQDDEGYKKYKKKNDSSGKQYKGRPHKGVDIINSKSKNKEKLKKADINTNVERKVKSIFTSADIFSLWIEGLGNTIALRQFILDQKDSKKKKYTGVIVFYAHMDFINISTEVNNEDFTNDIKEQNEKFLYTIELGSKQKSIGIYGKSGFDNLNTVDAHLHLEIYYNENFPQEESSDTLINNIQLVRNDKYLIDPHDITYFKVVKGLNFIKNKISDFIEIDDNGDEQSNQLSENITIKNVNILNEKLFLNNLVKKSINKYSSITEQAIDVKYKIFSDNEVGYYLTNSENIISGANKIINIKKTIDKIDKNIGFSIDFNKILNDLEIKKDNYPTFKIDNEDYDDNKEGNLDILRFFIPLRLNIQTGSTSPTKTDITNVTLKKYSSDENYFLLIRMKQDCILRYFDMKLENDGKFNIIQSELDKLIYKKDFYIHIVNGNLTKVDTDNGYVNIPQFELYEESNTFYLSRKKIGNTHLVIEEKVDNCFLNFVLSIDDKKDMNKLNGNITYNSIISSTFDLRGTQDSDIAKDYLITKSLYKDDNFDIIKSKIFTKLNEDFYPISQFEDSSDFLKIQKENSMQNNGFFFYDLSNYHISPFVTSPLLKQPIFLNSDQIYKDFKFNNNIDNNKNNLNYTSINIKEFIQFINNLISNNIKKDNKFNLFSIRFKKNINSFDDLYKKTQNTSGSSRLDTFVKYYTYGTAGAAGNKIFGSEYKYNLPIRFQYNTKDIIEKVVTYTGSGIENNLYQNIFDGFLRIDMEKYCKYLMTEVMKLEIVKIENT